MKKSLVVLIASILLCTVAVALIPYCTPKPVIVAEKLAYEPEQFVSIVNASPVLLQAISNVGKPVEVNSLDDIGIDNLKNERGAYIEYRDSYYQISVLIGDPSELYIQLMWLAIISLIISIILLIILSVRRLMKRRRYQQ